MCKFILFLIFPLITIAQYLNYDYSVTFGNHIIAINEINYDFQEGDILGCFFVNVNGQLQCCGSTIFNNEKVTYISAWPDDFLTEYQEGFVDGDELIIGMNLCDNYDYMSSSFNSFDSDFSIIHSEISYVTNGISQINIDLLSSPDCNFSLQEKNIINIDRKMIGVVDFLGQLTDGDSAKNLYFILYDDGSVEKKFIYR